MMLSDVLAVLTALKIPVRIIAGGMLAEYGFKTVFFTYKGEQVLYMEARRHVIDCERVRFTWRELHSLSEIVEFFAA